MGQKRKRKVGETQSLAKRLESALQSHLEAGEHVVLVTGAGLSVSSGIPPYRGASNAVWERSVQEWGTRAKFLEAPLTWFNEFWLPKFTTARVRQAQPNLVTLPLANCSSGSAACC